MKHQLIILAAIASSFVSNVKADPEGVWVAVRVLDRDVGQGVSEYYGTIDRDIFSTLTQTPKFTGFVRLNNAGSLYSGKFVHLKDETYEGHLCGYSSELYFRSERLIRIIPLEASFVKSTILKSKTTEQIGAVGREERGR